MSTVNLYSQSTMSNEHTDQCSETVLESPEVEEFLNNASKPDDYYIIHPMMKQKIDVALLLQLPFTRIPKIFDYPLLTWKKIVPQKTPPPYIKPKHPNEMVPYTECKEYYKRLGSNMSYVVDTLLESVLRIDDFTALMEGSFVDIPDMVHPLMHVGEDFSIVCWRNHSDWSKTFDIPCLRSFARDHYMDIMLRSLPNTGLNFHYLGSYKSLSDCVHITIRRAPDFRDLHFVYCGQNVYEDVYPVDPSTIAGWDGSQNRNMSEPIQLDYDEEYFFQNFTPQNAVNETQAVASAAVKLHNVTIHNALRNRRLN